LTYLPLGGGGALLLNSRCRELLPKSRRITLATKKNFFFFSLLQVLAQTLRVKFNLVCHINKHGNGHVIRITSKSLPVVEELLKDKMPKMMLHKIGL
jgi:hypothetical protein